MHCNSKQTGLLSVAVDKLKITAQKHDECHNNIKYGMTCKTQTTINMGVASAHSGSDCPLRNIVWIVGNLFEHI
jgi:hypothetical protein